MSFRSGGVLLHVSSLPGPHGIGDLGPAALSWIDWLAESGCSYWQVLPLGPSGFGDSPYSSPSSYAGNLNLVSPDLTAVTTGLGGEAASDPSDRVDYGSVIKSKWALVVEAHERAPVSVQSRFAEFRERESGWLEPHALFMALKDAHGGAAWTDWDESLRRRDRHALESARSELRTVIDQHAFGQFLFFEQLESVRRHAADRGIEIVGDVPLYVAMDSVEVWTRPDLFAIEVLGGRPREVAGVPPDSFSPLGQVWDTPLYDWDAHREDGFEWWVDRIESFSKQADVLRIDHFTGFCRYYAIDALTRDPGGGEWRDGPGAALFDEVRNRLGEIPMIVEDLGPVGDPVERLRVELGYPGMRVLQDAFSADATGDRLVQSFPTNCAVYTGTHDNDTAIGRFESEDEDYERRALAYTGGSPETFAWDLVSRAWESTSSIAIAPMQDLLGLGSEARMNVPGTAAGNWQWRLSEPPDSELALKLADLSERTGRRR